MGPAMRRGRTSRQLAVVVALSISAGAAGAASAAEAPERSRPTAIYGILGLGTPVGFVGLEVVHRLTPALEIAGALGLGDSAVNSEPNTSLGHDLQWSVMPRLRFGDDRHALTFGAGLSGGQYGGLHLIEGEEEAGRPYETNETLWLNAEIGGELQTREGLAFRFFIGGAVGETLDRSAALGPQQTYAIPYTGIGLGYAF